MSINELKRYLGICIHNSLYITSNIRNYWGNICITSCLVFLFYFKFYNTVLAQNIANFIKLFLFISNIVEFLFIKYYIEKVQNTHPLLEYL